MAVALAIPVVTYVHQTTIAEAKEAEARARKLAEGGEWLRAAEQWNTAREVLRSERPNNGTFGVIDWELYIALGVSSVAAALRMPDTATGWAMASTFLRGMRRDIIDYPRNEGNYKEVRTVDLELLGKLDLLAAFVRQGPPYATQDPSLVRTTWLSFSSTQQVSLDDFRQWLTDKTDSAIGVIALPRHPFYPLLAMLQQPERDPGLRRDDRP